MGSEEAVDMTEFDFLAADIPDESDVPAIKKQYPVLYNAKQLPKHVEEADANKPTLKKLKLKHRKMIAMHLSAISNTDIAEQLNCSASQVGKVLNDPLAQSVITEFAATQSEEFHRLEILANASLREALQPYKRDSVRMAAAKIFYGRKKDIGDEGEKGTAEDVMANLLQVINAENVQINYVGNQQAVPPLETNHE